MWFRNELSSLAEVSLYIIDSEVSRFFLMFQITILYACVCLLCATEIYIFFLLSPGTLGRKDLLDSDVP